MYAKPRVFATYLLILDSVVRVSQSTLPPCSISTLPPCFPFHLLADLGLGGAGLPVYVTPRVSHSTYLLILVYATPRVSHSTYLLILVSVVRVSQSTLPPCFPFHLLADLGLGGAGLPVYATPRVSHSTYLLILVSVVRVSQSTLPPVFPIPPTC